MNCMQEELIEAASTGDKARCELLLTQGADLNSSDTVIIGLSFSPCHSVFLFYIPFLVR